MNFLKKLILDFFLYEKYKISQLRTNSQYSPQIIDFSNWIN
jgi:hypothetical protein